MSYIKSIPLKKLAQYSQDDDEIVLLSSTNEQPTDSEDFADIVLALLAGETVVVDAFIVTDLDGSEIPANAYGQKAGVPFFGDTSLYDQVRKATTLLNSAVLPIADNTLYYKLLGSFPLSASDAVDNKRFEIQFSMMFDSSGGTPGSNSFYIGVQLGESAPTMAHGSWVDITPASAFERSAGRGVVTIAASTGNLRPLISVPSLEVAAAASIVSVGSIKPFVAPTINSPSVFTAPEGTATTLSFYLIHDVTTADFAAYIANGFLELFSDNITAGDFT